MALDRLKEKKYFLFFLLSVLNLVLQSSQDTQSEERLGRFLSQSKERLGRFLRNHRKGYDGF